MSRYLAPPLLVALLLVAGCSTTSWQHGLQDILPHAGAEAAVEELTPVVQQALSTEIAAGMATLDRAKEQAVKVHLEGEWCFGVDGASLSPVANAALRRLGRALAGVPGTSVTVTCHTDGIGSLAENQQLSSLRADAVAAVLRAQGLAGVRAEAKGSTEPLATNATEAGRRVNNRIELHIGPNGG